MNKKYYKRLIQLHKLGIEIDNRYIFHYDTLNKLIGNISEYETLCLSKEVIYYRGNLDVFHYNLLAKDIFLDSHIYFKYMGNNLFGIEDNPMVFLQAFLEHTFNLEVKAISSIDNYTKYD